MYTTARCKDYQYGSFLLVFSLTEYDFVSSAITKIVQPCGISTFREFPEERGDDSPIAVYYIKQRHAASPATSHFFISAQFLTT